MNRILLLLFILGSGRLVAQVDSAAMMKSYMDYMTPGEMHTMLAKFDGTWDTKIIMWVTPDAPPDSTTGTVVNRMTMGGRFQESTNTASMMGVPFEGVGITGYDNAKKLFVTTWMDNLSTGIMNMEGEWNAATNTIHFKGRSMNPLVNKEVEIREIVKFINNDTYQMEMYGPDLNTGIEFKMMEIKCTRKK